MLRYTLYRLTLALPTLIIISMVIFAVNRCSPYDPVEEKLASQQQNGYVSPGEEERLYRREAAQFGFDRPVFYVGLQPAIYPDTLYGVFPPGRRARLCSLTVACGDWPAVAALEQKVWQATNLSRKLPADTPWQLAVSKALSDLQTSSDRAQLEQALSDFRTASDSLRQYQPDWAPLADTLQYCGNAALAGRAANPWALPALHWHGTHNQYHRWISGFLLHGELGYSRLTYKPVWRELRPLLAATLVLNCTALLLGYLIAVPLGVVMARRRGRRTDRWGQWALLLLYAVPVFWLGSMLMLLFASPAVFDPPPIRGVYLPSWRDSGLSLFAWVAKYAGRFVLPVATLTLHSLASLALQMRGSILETLGQDYIRTARAKGLSENRVYWRHAFRNALFPLITSFAGIFPAVFAGSLVVEYMFGFPGIGAKTQDAFRNSDEPMLLAILMLSAVLTVIGMLVADILYVRADPRVKFRR